MCICVSTGQSSAGHHAQSLTQCFLWASLAPHWAVAVSFITVCVCASAWLRSSNGRHGLQNTALCSCADIFLQHSQILQQMQKTAARSSSPADGLVQRSGKCWLKLLSFQVGVLSARLLPLWDLGLCYCKEKGRYQVTVTQREESMVRKARRRASQWDSGMPMVPLKSRESGDVQMVLFVSWVFFCQASLCIA